MKKIAILILALMFTPIVGISQTNINYSLNTLNPYGVSLSHTGDKIFSMLNWNYGDFIDEPGYEIHKNEGIYAVGDLWQNRKIGNVVTKSFYRNILTASLGYVILNKNTTKVSLYLGGGIYTVKEENSRYWLVTDDLGVLDNYVILNERSSSRISPIISTAGVFVNHNMFSYGLGINTPPIGSGSPPRFNLLIGVSL